MNVNPSALQIVKNTFHELNNEGPKSKEHLLENSHNALQIVKNTSHELNNDEPKSKEFDLEKSHKWKSIPRRCRSWKTLFTNRTTKIQVQGT